MKKRTAHVLLAAFLSLLLTLQSPLSLAFATNQAQELPGGEAPALEAGNTASEGGTSDSAVSREPADGSDPVAADKATADVESDARSGDDSKLSVTEEPALVEVQTDQDIEVVTQDDSSIAIADDSNASGAEVRQDGKAAKPESVVRAEQAAPSVSVLAYMQRSGWSKKWAKKGLAAGSPGSGLRMEAIRLRLENAESIAGSILCRPLLQTRGWKGWRGADKVVGSTGNGLRMEALQIKLTKTLAKTYDVYYRVYVDTLGWMAWAKNGETAGTAGKELRIEGLQVKLVSKDEDAPTSDDQTTNVPFVGVEDIRVSTYVQSRGWTPKVSKGKVAGAAAKGLRVEAIQASLVGARVPGNVEICAYVQTTGWTKWVQGGSTLGKANSGKRIEAIKVRLTGDAAKVYDVYYQVYAKGVGWLAWAQNGALAGSTGLYLQVEAVRIKLVAMGAKAPSSNKSNWPKPQFSKLKVGYASKVNDAWMPRVWNGKTSGTTGKGLPVQGIRMVLGGADAALAGSIIYSVHIPNEDWSDWEANNTRLVSPQAVGYLDAIQMQITGTASEVYDIWYRAHVQGVGWMGWAKNGASAGTIGANKRIEAVQVRLVPKYKNKAPGTTVGAFMDWSIRKALDAAKSSRTITAFGGYSMGSTVSKNLNKAVQDIRNKGYDVGFIMMDLATHKGISYNCDSMFYGASSIKGPYFASVVYKHPEAVKTYQHDITEALFYSWDYNYKQVLAAYGKGPMRTWCAESGVRKAIAESLPWANYSARELAKMWARTYLLYQQSSAGEQLGKWCERPNVSTIHSVLGGKYRTRSKAGWIDAGGSSTPSINGGGPLYRVADDGGIVYAKNGAYVLAIMSSFPADHDALNPLTRAIDAAHQQM